MIPAPPDESFYQLPLAFQLVVAAAHLLTLAFFVLRIAGVSFTLRGPTIFRFLGGRRAQTRRPLFRGVWRKRFSRGAGWGTSAAEGSWGNRCEQHQSTSIRKR